MKVIVSGLNCIVTTTEVIQIELAIRVSSSISCCNICTTFVVSGLVASAIFEIILAVHIVMPMMIAVVSQ